MSAEPYNETLKTCQRHVDRLCWSMQQMQAHTPFTADTLNDMNGEFKLQAAIINKAYQLATPSHYL